MELKQITATHYPDEAWVEWLAVDTGYGVYYHKKDGKEQWSVSGEEDDYDQFHTRKALAIELRLKAQTLLRLSSAIEKLEPDLPPVQDKSKTQFNSWIDNQILDELKPTTIMSSFFQEKWKTDTSAPMADSSATTTLTKDDLFKAIQSIENHAHTPMYFNPWQVSAIKKEIKDTQELAKKLLDGAS